MTSKLDASNTDSAQKEKILAYAAETRRFEIERFWQRSLFFWGFIAAAFVAYAGVSNMSKIPNASDLDNGLKLPIACFGIIASIAWTLINRGSKYWQEAWEQKVAAVESDVLGAKLFSNKEPLQRDGPWGPARFSASKLTVALSDFTVLVWFLLAFEAFPTHVPPATDPIPYIIVAVTGLYAVCLFCGGRSK